MAGKGLRYQLEKSMSGRNDWNRTFLRMEKSWKELNQFLEKKDTKKKR